MCKQSTIRNTTPPPPPPPPMNATGCGIDRSCPSSVTSSPFRGATRLDEYQSKSPMIRRQQRKRISIIKDTDFEWYDLDALEDSSDNDEGDDDNACLEDVSKGIEINVIIDPITNHSSHSHGSSNNPFDRFLFGANEEKDDREFREQLERLEREMSRTA